MLNKEIPEEVLKKIRLVVFDSDGVSISRGTDISEKVTKEAIEIKIKTNVITDNFRDLVNRLRKRLYVCVSSGRSLLYLESMYGPIMGKKTILQAENGNLSLIEGRIVQHFEYDESYFRLLSLIRQDARKLNIKGIEPKQFILSIHAENEIAEMYDVVKKHDKNNILKVMWNGEAFDIQKKEVSKASGLKKLINHLGINREEVIAMGDRINDKELLESSSISVSADKEAVPAPYWTESKGLPGEILAEYLVKKLSL